MISRGGNVQMEELPTRNKMELLVNQYILEIQYLATPSTSRNGNQPSIQ